MPEAYINTSGIKIGAQPPKRASAFSPATQTSFQLCIVGIVATGLRDINGVLSTASLRLPSLPCKSFDPWAQ